MCYDHHFLQPSTTISFHFYSFLSTCYNLSCVIMGACTIITGGMGFCFLVCWFSSLGVSFGGNGRLDASRAAGAAPHVKVDVAWLFCSFMIGQTGILRGSSRDITMYLIYICTCNSGENLRETSGNTRFHDETHYRFRFSDKNSYKHRADANEPNVSGEANLCGHSLGEYW